jgi:hypothetical protein
MRRAPPYLSLVSVHGKKADSRDLSVQQSMFNMEFSLCLCCILYSDAAYVFYK